jgi:hypothetical protein
MNPSSVIAYFSMEVGLPNMKATEYTQKQALKNTIITVNVSMNFVMRSVPC